MARPLLRPTHLLVTALLLIAGLAGVTAGLTGADDREAITWSMPEPEPGRHASYTYAVYDASGEQLIGVPRTLFEIDVMEPTPILDANGTMRVLHGLRTTHWGYVPEDMTWNWAPQSASVVWRDGSDVIALDVHVDDWMPFGGSRSELAGVTLRSDDPQEERGWRYTRAHDWMERLNTTGHPPLRMHLPCAMVHPFWNGPVALDAPISARCDQTRLPSDPSAVKVEQTGDLPELYLPSRTTWVGMEASGIAENATQRALVADASAGGWRIWYPDDLPFPSRVEWLDGDRLHVISLAETHIGDPLPGDRPATGDIDLPSTGPMIDGLPDDRGAGHPFPASRAWEIARDDEAVADFIDDHPDGRMKSFRYLPGEDAGWEFTLRAPGDLLRATVTETEASGTLSTLPAPVRPEPAYDVEVSGNGGYAVIPMDAYPTTAPIVREAVRAAEEAGMVLDDWGWSYQAECDNSFGCTAGQGKVTITSTSYTERESLDPETGIETSTSSRQTALRFAGDGRVDGGASYDRTTTSGAALDEPGAVPDRPTPASAPTPLREPTAFGDVATAAGGLSLLAAVIYFFWPVAKNGVVALFSRVRPERALDHPTRQRIAEIVASEPGIHGHGIARRAELHRSTVDHHLRKLVDCGRFIEHRAPGYTCYFPKGTDRRIVAAAPALKSDTARGVLRTVLERPGATAGDVARDVGITRSTASHHIQRLRDAGILRSERDGQAIRLWVATGMVTASGSGIAA